MIFLLLSIAVAFAMLPLATTESVAQRRFPAQLNLDSRSLDTLYTPDATLSTHRYRITAWGTYSMWEDTVNSSVDPMWIYSFPEEEWAKLEWRIFTDGYPIYVGDDRMLNSHGLRINNLPMPKQTLNTSHTYTMTVQGTGKPISASIIDWNFRGFVKQDAHDNNSGWLRVFIEELPVTTVEVCGIDSSRFPVIRLSLQVRRDSVRFVDLAGRLVVSENGVPVHIDSIDCSERTSMVSAALVIDRSGSMREAFGTSTRMAQVQSAGKRFVDKLSDADEAAVYSFSATTTINQNWTSNRTSLKRAIDVLQPDGWTAMNDAILRAIDETERRPASRKKAIIVLSDGEDNRSVIQSIRTVSARARQAGIPVYAIGLLLDNDDSLRLLTSETGGMYFSISDASAMDSAFSKIADAMLEKGCCSVYYTSPDIHHNGTFRPVIASVAFESDTLVQRSVGYRAPGTVSAVETQSESSITTQIIALMPSPMHGNGQLHVSIAEEGFASITIFDVEGRTVATPHQGTLSAGQHMLPITLDGLPAGRYFVQLSIGGVRKVYGVVVER